MSGSTCPFLGMKGDRETAVAYPSLWNQCYAGEKTQDIEFDHQSDYCIGANHIRCPIFQQKVNEPTMQTVVQPPPPPVIAPPPPPSLEGTEPVKIQEFAAPEEEENLPSTPNRALLVGLIVVGLLAIGGVIWWAASTGSSLIPILIATRTATPTRTFTPTPPPTRTFTPSPTRTPAVTVTRPALVTYTPTLQPSPSPTSTYKAYVPTYQAPTQACMGVPYGWVPYVVKAGDTWYGISVMSGVSVYQLQAANCLQGAYLYVGRTIYVPNVPIPSPVYWTHTPTDEYPTPTGTSEYLPTTTPDYNITPTPYIYPTGESTADTTAPQAETSSP